MNLFFNKMHPGEEINAPEDLADAAEDIFFSAVAAKDKRKAQEFYEEFKKLPFSQKKEKMKEFLFNHANILKTILAKVDQSNLAPEVKAKIKHFFET